MPMLNLPRPLKVSFNGAFIASHPNLAKYAGQVLSLHAGLNNVDDDVMEHPVLARFISTEVAASKPVSPQGGSGPDTAGPQRRAPAPAKDESSKDKDAKE